MKDRVEDVVIADDHPITRFAVEAIVDEQAGFQCLASVANGVELLDLLAVQPADVAVVDYSMPAGDGCDGLALVDTLCSRYPALRIVVLTALDQWPIIQVLLTRGVAAVVSKSDDLRHVARALLAASQGRRYFSPAILACRDVNGFDSAGELLSPREAQVVHLLLAGKGVNEIALELAVTKQTVSTQKRAAMRKLGVSSNAELFRFASELGLE
ncbi:response regulator transcription factor [Stenotrophomonas maltophilia]|uniref:response regulator transcription factor n=1 Tax=Stenotrophomonas maltophilia TaxID=40324 RepID=UPI0007F01E6D|nr:response regulator transcription factor [Stenotrophomonas maltophilia]MCO7397771.1 response regulator transcription factor [Stenotrophomonas maltophilia]MCO7409964.1 response regulator transcription factor [Stenotrophomonas maltophilia]OBU47944.1 hypothetical protein A9K76_18225 [Stenotrophomonas maltophilia]OBU48077.1 hypothetical protein A9K76_17610 [Stenotrophomonas maltophilia]HDS1649591.1 response regulator transcription factor [Stenotrophomonas maltophilia]